MVRLVVVDDCPIFRHLIKSFAEMNGDIKVVGEAVNGFDAIEKLNKLSPDIMTLDINMPVMDGMEAIEHIMSKHPLPILVVTSRGDSETAYQAISIGALEVLPKAEISSDSYHSFSEKIKLLSKVKVISHIRSKKNNNDISKLHSLSTSKESKKIIGIASSTGGPSALAQILEGLPKTFKTPIVISQHLSDGFLPGLLKWLDRVSQLKIKQGEPGEIIQQGHVYISPPEKHMEITKKQTISFTERTSKDHYFPSCDKLLKSIAYAYKTASIGIVLTGMGSDGLFGMQAIKEQGGFTIAQDEKSSAIFGMPKAVINHGYADKILHLNEISEYLISILNERS